MGMHFIPLHRQLGQSKDTANTLSCDGVPQLGHMVNLAQKVYITASDTDGKGTAPKTSISIPPSEGWRHSLLDSVR